MESLFQGFDGLLLGLNCLLLHSKDVSPLLHAIWKVLDFRERNSGIEVIYLLGQLSPLWQP
jgi:hypothetical protein